MAKKTGPKRSGKKSKTGKNKKSKKVSKKIPPAMEPEVQELPPPPPPPPSQGQFICVHVGQAGIRVGSACWELFCYEHGIDVDGTIRQLATNSTSMFSLSEADTYVPRALLVDTEPSAIDAIKSGCYKNLFSARNTISGKEDAASSYAAGFYGVGQKLTSTVMDQLARLAENCDSLQGIALFRSIGGGTGSGMGSRIIESVKNTYPNKTVIDFNVYSSELAPIIVEPYNIALATHRALDAVDCSLLFDNRFLYEMCSSKLNLPNPVYKNINNIIALVLSGITSSLRFEGSMTSNISELLRHLTPQPRLHFPIVSYAPIANSFDSISSATTQLAAMSFDRGNRMTDIDTGLGKYLSVCMMFRGDLKPTEINTTIAFMQREQSVPITHNTSSPLFKFGLCLQPPVTVPHSGIAAATRSVTTLCNNTAVKYCWTKVMEKYNRLLTKRAFLHHYTGEGMEEEEFRTANESISELIAEYEEIENS